ncbi:MAG: hypothetical protein WBP16_05780 [Ferruginibacter sp.]
MLIILLFAIVSGIAIIIPAKDIIIDPYGTGRSKLKPGGILLLIAVILLIILPVVQYNIQKKEETTRNKELKIGYDSSLAEIKKKFDSTSFKTDSLIADNLGKYGYKFDSTSNRLEKIVRDSSKTRIIQTADPVLDLREIQNVKVISISPAPENKFDVIIHYTSSDAGSGSYEIVLSTVTKDSLNNFSYVGNLKPLKYTTQIPSGGSRGTGFSINNPKKFTHLFFWIRGKYKNIDKSKAFSMDEVYFLDYKSGDYGTASVSDNKLVKSIVYKNEK